MKVLLSGRPGAGKTTVVKKLSSISPLPVSGFLTAEIRERGRRIGFTISSLPGAEKNATLAHREMESTYRVGPYGVCPESLDPFIDEMESYLRTEKARDTLFLIDEIGKMELFNHRFLPLVRKILETPGIPVVATILAASHPQTDPLKKIRGIRLIEVYRENRDQLPLKLAQKIGGEKNAGER